MLLTLLTDFGTGSPYVAAMKGVMLSIHPAAVIVDLTHDVPPQDIRYGALVLEDVAERFPRGTLHVAVVDPGVGTSRALVYAEIGDHRYLAPDNGLLSRLALRQPPTRIIRLTESRWWLPKVSATFHGRDILAPVAAHLSLGVDPAALGVPHKELVMLAWPQPRIAAGQIQGHVLWIDRFGNLITNITVEVLAAAGVGPNLVATCCEKTTLRHVRSYGQADAGDFITVIGSSDRLDLAVVDGSAAGRLRARIGDRVTITW
jgi:hypothetical protein